jgi:hypothetical protein
MKPSVHLQHVATGALWVGHCTGEPQPGNFIRFGCGDFWVGRKDDCEIRLEDDSVSRRHATLRLIDNRLYFDDNHSRMGVQVNDKPRQVRKKRGDGAERDEKWTETHASDLLRFGNVAVRILWAGEGLSPFTPAHLAWNNRTAVQLARLIVNEARFDHLPILADALEEAGCSDPVALACFRKGVKSTTTDYLLQHILGATPSFTVVHSRPMGRRPRPQYMHDPVAAECFPRLVDD